MKIPKPALADAMAEAERTLAQRNDELDAIRAEIAAAEAALYALAESDDDTAFEAAVLKIERLRRRDLRAEKRLIAAEVAHAEAEAREEQGRQRELYSAGLKAAAEAEKLTDAYADHASAIAEILRAIDKLRPPIDAANDALPEGKHRIDAHAFAIYRGVELPAATKDGPKFWYRPDYYGRTPLNPPPKPAPGHILLDGVYVPFDEANPAHIAARDARPSIPLPPASKSTPQPASDFGELTLPDGSRKIKLPPNEWPPASASN